MAFRTENSRQFFLACFHLSCQKITSFVNYSEWRVWNITQCLCGLSDKLTCLSSQVAVPTKITVFAPEHLFCDHSHLTFSLKFTGLVEKTQPSRDLQRALLFPFFPVKVEVYKRENYAQWNHGHLHKLEATPKGVDVLWGSQICQMLWNTTGRIYPKQMKWLHTKELENAQPYQHLKLSSSHNFFWKITNYKRNTFKRWCIPQVPRS